jgi:mono/diheme cytochrome c family protein
MFSAMLLTTVLLLAASAKPGTLPPGKGKAIVQRICISCHALKVVTAKRASKEQWSVLVDQMISRGAELDDDEVEVIVDYLARNFGTTKVPASTKPNHSQTGPVNGNHAAATQSRAE